MRDWRKEKLAFTIFALPGTFWLIVFFTLPLCIVWAYSFLERGPQGQIEWGVITFANYTRAVEWIHLGIIWKSMWIAAITTFWCILLGFPMAMGIAFAPSKWKNPLLLLVTLPFFTNLLIRTYAWIAILRTKGYLNSTLGLLGVEPTEFLYNQFAVIVGLIYVNLPFLILPLYATLEKFDKSFLEASLDLGASQWRTFFSVLIPLALPGIVSGSMLVFILSLGTYLTPSILGGTDSEMIGTLIARQFGPSRDHPFGAAISFLLLYATFILLWLRAFMAQHSKGTDI